MFIWRNRKQALWLVIAAIALIPGLFFIPSFSTKTSSTELQTLLPLHLKFSAIAAKNKQEDYKEALNDAVLLQKELNTTENSYLYVLNLYQIGILQKKLGNTTEEQATWEQLERLTSTQEASASLKAACQLLSQNLSSEETTLADYLDARKAQLQTTGSH